MIPLRIQRKRTRGWRLPPNTLCVSRPSKWGNPYRVYPTYPINSVPQLEAVRRFRRLLLDPSAVRGDSREFQLREWMWEHLDALRGRNLACWCRLCPEHSGGKPFDVECSDCAPCHADVLGRLANQEG